MTSPAPGAPYDEHLRRVFNHVERFLERRYGLPVILTDVPDPYTGDLDGEKVMVDWAVHPEEALFILVHLFGHTVQWNLSERYRELGLVEVRAGDAVPEPFLAELEVYEVEAARYSLQLLHDAGVTDLDQWVSDFSSCDIAYLMHYYRTGEKREFRSFWRNGVPCLTPLAIPPFTLTRWTSRQGTVI